ncbi:MAG TPA: helix-turn-helix transcriptional regulator [Drouetiella sp.]
MNKIIIVLSRNILRRRKELGLTQQQLADAAKCHRSEIGTIESGNRNFTVSRLMQIAQALEMSLENLLHDSSDKPLP